MLTGTYLVQKDKRRFSNGRVDPICPLCAPHYTVYGRINVQDSKNWSSRILELTHGHKHLIQWNH